MQIIDTHAHIHDDIFHNDIEAVINSCLCSHVTKILLPTTNNSDIIHAISFKKQYTTLCDVMCGIHPNNVTSDILTQQKLLEQYIANYDFIAIGEVGLDFYKSTTEKELQIKMFKVCLSIANNLSLPVSIHSRNAFEDTYSILKHHQHGNLTGVIHCFSGTKEEAKKYIDLGFVLGIGGIITFKNSNLCNEIKTIPLKNIVLETDSPYLSPHPHRGERNTPANITFIIEKLSEIYNLPTNDIITSTTLTSKNIFKL